MYLVLHVNSVYNDDNSLWRQLHFVIQAIGFVIESPGFEPCSATSLERSLSLFES